MGITPSICAHTVRYNDSIHINREQVALSFINDPCASTHGNLRPDSIFISPSGEWKLGGFELLSNPKDEAAVLYVRSDHACMLVYLRMKILLSLPDIGYIATRHCFDRLTGGEEIRVFCAQRVRVSCGH